jgi:uncharacterized protein
MQNTDHIISQTKTWINNVVIGCNFCPFAAREVKRNSILYEVIDTKDKMEILQSLSSIFTKMDNDEDIETAFLILLEGFSSFATYLDLVETAENFLVKEKYEGIYQLASFHPQYLFAGSDENDAANYTNRSPHPMLHILREESLSKAIDNHPNVNDIPQHNIDFAREKGLEKMRALAQVK